MVTYLPCVCVCVCVHARMCVCVVIKNMSVCKKAIQLTMHARFFGIFVHGLNFYELSDLESYSLFPYFL